MTDINTMSRDQIQDYLLDEYWRKHGGNGTFECCTSFGKTVMACKAINRVRAAKGKDFPVKIVLNRTNHLVNWKNDIKTFVKPEFQDNIEVYIINTFVNSLITGKIVNTEEILLIVDEIHNYGGDIDEATKKEFVRMWEFKYRFILGLSATVERLDGWESSFTAFAPVLFKIPLETAVENGWVAPYQEINIRMQLPFADSDSYEKVSYSLSKDFEYFNKNFNIISKMAADLKAASEYGKNHNGLTGIEVKNEANSYLSKLQRRKKLLQQHILKEDIVVSILSSTNCKTIIFSPSIDFVENLKNKLEPFRKVSVYHSKLKKKEKDEALQSFLSGKTDVMISASALNEGFSDDKLYLGIAASYNSNPKNNVQRKGRVCRLRKDGTLKKAIFVNLMFANTKEEDWLESSQKTSIPSEFLSLEDTIEKINLLNDK